MNELALLRSYSGIATRLRPSIIRELLKAIAKPGVISFAGGLPAEEIFPAEGVRNCCCQVLDSDPACLQYGPTEGFTGLKDEIIKWLSTKGIHATHDMITFATGAQQAVSLLATIFLDENDLVLVEEPTYPGSVSAIDLQRPEFRVLPSLPDGHLDMERIERQMRYAGCKPKLVYLVPTFANPTGKTISQENRDILLMLAHRYGFPIIEDDPYYDLRYAGTPVPPMKALPGGEQVIHLGSFSKVLAPGFRLGYIVAEPELIKKFVVLKQAVDMESSGFLQRVAAAFLARGYMEPHLARLKAVYGERLAAMATALRDHMPEGTWWMDVQGGMFIWLTLPERIDTEVLLSAALERDVAYIPGRPFCIGGGGKNSMRLNFTNAAPDLIREGIGRLGELFAAALG
ncbi:PLP-dependent aminotransferase family protein [bacterium]|nr:PLP-dependent aminotransferase family protein [candidate division CSSED10-310 bacterium]